MKIEETVRDADATISLSEVDWDAIYADQLPRVCNYFRFQFGRHVDFEELTARTFEKAWRARNRYRCDVAGFSTWLFTVARNVGIDYLRTLRAHEPLEVAIGTAADGTVQDAAEHASDLTRLAKLTADLPERERELIALKYGAGLSNRLIAQLAGLSESNVGVILHRTVQTLRSQWQEKV
jgi:RNA polymerase sigma-70 factor (ECF subfamily)